MFKKKKNTPPNVNGDQSRVEKLNDYFLENNRVSNRALSITRSDFYMRLIFRVTANDFNIRQTRRVRYVEETTRSVVFNL